MSTDYTPRDGVRVEYDEHTVRFIPDFDVVDDAWAAMSEAKSFLEALGYCTGPSQVMPSAIAAFYGDGKVSKWRNLSAKEKSEAAAIIAPLGGRKFRGNGAQVDFRPHAPVMPDECCK